MRRRIDQLLLVVMVALAVGGIARQQWPYVLIGLLGAIIAGLSMRIDRLQDEITALRLEKLLGPPDTDDWRWSP